MPRLDNHVDLLFVAVHHAVLQALYYCPRCETANEIAYPQDLRQLVCRECGQENNASEAKIETTNPRAESE
jgi:hypothetical protein